MSFESFLPPKPVSNQESSLT